jgi:hypothetical protein
MPNYGGESSGGSDIGGGNYEGGSSTSGPGLGGGNGGGGNGFFDFMSGSWMPDFQRPPASSYVDVMGSVSDGGRGGNYLPQQQQQFAPQPQMSPLQLMAQQQAQMDMNGGGQWGQYSSPQMNPMQTYDSSGWQPPFQFGQFFGGK